MFQVSQLFGRAALWAAAGACPVSAVRGWRVCAKEGLKAAEARHVSEGSGQRVLKRGPGG